MSTEFLGLDVSAMSLLTFFSILSIVIVSFTVSAFYAVRVLRHSADPFRFALLALLLVLGVNNLPLALFGLGFGIDPEFFAITRIISAIVIIWVVWPLIVDFWKEFCMWINLCLAKIGYKRAKKKSDQT